MNILNILLTQGLVVVAFIITLLISLKNPLKLTGTKLGYYYVVPVSILIGYLSASVGIAFLFAGISAVVITVASVINKDFK